ncbi:MAG: hypothetical protein Q8P67_16565 [archaeon]|nr:hypothetical protein [archaeon]
MASSRSSSTTNRLLERSRMGAVGACAAKEGAELPSPTLPAADAAAGDIRADTGEDAQRLARESRPGGGGADPQS